MSGRPSITYATDDRALSITRIQGCLFANDMKMCTAICLGDVPIIQNEQYRPATNPVKNNFYLYGSPPWRITDIVPDVKNSTSTHTHTHTIKRAIICRFTQLSTRVSGPLIVTVDSVQLYISKIRSETNEAETLLPVSRSLGNKDLDPLSDLVPLSDQLMQETSGGDQWNTASFDSIGPVHWFPPATDRVVGLSLTVHRGI